MTRLRVERVDRGNRIQGEPRRRLRRAVVWVFAGLALLFMLPEIGVANQAQVRELFVDWANTVEEHVAAASYYSERAEESRQEVVRHEQMGARYAEGHMETRREQAAHCERIASLHRQLASEYEALAKNHRQEAERREREAGDRAK